MKEQKEKSKYELNSDEYINQMNKEHERYLAAHPRIINNN